MFFLVTVFPGLQFIWGSSVPRIQVFPLLMGFHCPQGSSVPGVQESSVGFQLGVLVF